MKELLNWPKETKAASSKMNNLSIICVICAIGVAGCGTAESAAPPMRAHPGSTPVAEAAVPDTPRAKPPADAAEINEEYDGPDVPLTRSRIISTITGYGGRIIYSGLADLNMDGKSDFLTVAEYGPVADTKRRQPAADEQPMRAVQLYAGRGDSTFEIWTEGQRAIPPARSGIKGAEETSLSNFITAKGRFSFTWTNGKHFKYTYTFSFSRELETLILSEFYIAFDRSPTDAGQSVKDASLKGAELGKLRLEEFDARKMTGFYDPAIRGLFGM